jgi:hypothetical protein
MDERAGGSRRDGENERIRPGAMVVPYLSTTAAFELT